MLAITLITLASLVGSFCCSLLEACVFSVSRSRIESLRNEGHRSGEVLARMRANIDEAIAAILIINTFAHSFGAVLAGGLVDRYYGDWRLGVLTSAILFAVFFTVSVLFFSEIVPKSLGVNYANRLAPYIALPLYWLIVALKPMVFVCVAVTRLWGKDTGLHHATEQDIINLAALGHRQGQILPEEVNWVTNALRLNDMTAYNLMTPNNVVERVPEGLKLADTTIDTQHWRFSRLPVCRNDAPDEIVGVVHRAAVFDALARDKFDRTMADLMLPARVVPAETPANELLELFLRERRHLFCVQSKEEVFIGVVTLEDVLECLLGVEIVDESDLHEDMQQVALQKRKQLLQQSEDLIQSQVEERSQSTTPSP